MSDREHLCFMMFNQITDKSAPVMQAGLSMVVWILKREVRAIGGCLGIHRR